MGNLDSVFRAVQECGGQPALTARAEEIAQCTHVILPGVGSFGAGMRNIRSRGLDQALQENVRSRGVPVLGICLGMQLLATFGREGGETQGLGWISGEVRRLKPNGHRERIPHVGWNEVALQQSCPLFRTIPSGKDFYFVHSYVFDCEDSRHVLGTTAYCGGFASVVGDGRIFGVQFHPEKSQRAGFELLRNFLSM
ncbi:MAG: imidazole glycerol phosphate synthase subunit HisH [Candidatus Acidiferrales bacterium]